MACNEAARAATGGLELALRARVMDSSPDSQAPWSSHEQDDDHWWHRHDSGKKIIVTDKFQG